MAAESNAVVLPSILLVEDHQGTLDITARLLNLSGFDALPVNTCAAALAAAERTRFDLVVCDIGLSDGDGCALFRQLREKYGMGGIAYSGYGMPQDFARSRDAGFTVHLVKPMAYPDLLAAIRAALAERTAPVAFGA